MKSIILAAGRGSRMKGLTDERPKCLTELGGRSLLDWQTQALSVGVGPSIAVVAGYRGDLLENRGLTVFTNARWSETNMVVSLTCAASWLEAGPCLVSYGDIIYTSAAVRRLAEVESDIAISYDPDWYRVWAARFADPLSDAETFKLSADGIVTDIGHRPKSLDEVQGQYMGLLRFTSVGWDRVSRHLALVGSEAAAKLDMTSLLRALIEGGASVRAVPVEGPWGEVDSATDLMLYESQGLAASLGIGP